MRRPFLFFALVLLAVSSAALYVGLKPERPHADRNRLWDYAFAEPSHGRPDSAYWAGIQWISPATDSRLTIPSGRALLLKTDIDITDPEAVARLIFTYDHAWATTLFINGDSCASFGQRLITPSVDLDDSAPIDRLPVEEFWRPHHRHIPGRWLRHFLRYGDNSVVVMVTNSSTLADFRPSHTELHFVCQGGKPEVLFEPDALSFDTSSLPILCISTGNREIPNDPKVPAVVDIIDYRPGKSTLSAKPVSVDIRIERRGHTSLAFPKGSYGFNIHGLPDGMALLGMPRAEKWVLHGPYADKSLIRNELAYALSRAAGRYAPRTRAVELVVNDNYQGVYALTERISIGKDHFDIPLLRTDSTGRLSGGYLLEIDRNEWVSATQGIPEERLVYYEPYYPPKSMLTLETHKVIKSRFDRVELALLTGEDLETAIDLASFADYFLIQELTKNPDAYRLSTYPYDADINSPEPRLGMGPVWDFDLAFGLKDSPVARGPNGWVYATHPGIPLWWERLWAYDPFNDLLRSRWQSLRSDSWATDRLMATVDSLAAERAEAAERNFRKWPLLGAPSVWPNHYTGATYTDEVKYLKTWLSARVEWMDAELKTLD